MKEYAEKFYKSKIWQRVRDDYIGDHGLCERCAAQEIVEAAVIVHHKIELTPKNIDDPRITIATDNLEAVCRKCHGARHGRKRRYTVDKTGRVTFAPPVGGENEDHGRPVCPGKKD